VAGTIGCGIDDNFDCVENCRILWGSCSVGALGAYTECVSEASEGEFECGGGSVRPLAEVCSSQQRNLEQSCSSTDPNVEGSNGGTSSSSDPDAGMGDPEDSVGGSTNSSAGDAGQAGGAGMGSGGDSASGGQNMGGMDNGNGGATNQAGSGGMVNSAGAAGMGNDPECAVGAGTNGLISDFTNGAFGRPNDNRSQESWDVYNANPDALLGVESGELHCSIEWLSGACGVPLSDSCYDASAYSGIRFDVTHAEAAVGAEAIVWLRVLATVPTSEGGTCTLDEGLCYDSYRAVFTVPSTWSTLSFPWSSFAQPGFSNEQPPSYEFEAEVMSILVSPTEGNPLSVLIDDVELY
jgi:hypothetical protein